METQDVSNTSELIQDPDSLPERDTGVNISECDILANLKPTKKRIVYERNFLMTCARNPASKITPTLPATLECISGRKLKSETGNANQMPKKVEVKKEKEPEDTISLRPHSGNFSSGCAANISPTQITQSSYSRFCIHEEKFTNDWERTARLNSNLKAQQQQMMERNRMDRERLERDRIDRDQRGRGQGNMRGRSSQQNFWTAENNEASNDWNRRGKNNGNNRESRSGRYGSHRPEREEELPDWFSEGPKNRYETMELRGFQDDDRREPINERKAPDNNESQNQRRSEPLKRNTNATNEETGNEDEGFPKTPSSHLDFNLDNFLEMDQISSILPNSFNENEARGSRFSQFFNKSSDSVKEAPAPKREDKPAMTLNTLSDRKSDEAEAKPKEVCDLENALRNILLKNPEREENPKVDPKPNDGAHFGEMGVFQKLIDQAMPTPGHMPREPEAAEMYGKVPMRGFPPAKEGDAFNFMDIWHHRDTNADMLAQEKLRFEQQRKAELQHYVPGAGAPIKILTMPQVLASLSREANLLVVNAAVTPDFLSQYDVVKYLKGISRGDVTIHSLIQMLGVSTHPNKFILCAIMKMCLKGAITIKGLQLQSPNNPYPPQMGPGGPNMHMRHPNPGHHQYMMPQHQPPHLQPPHHQPPHHQQPHHQQPHHQQPHHHQPQHQQQMPIGRPDDQSQGDQAQKRNGASATLSFTPTAVMRRMNADQQLKVPTSIPTSVPNQPGAQTYGHGPVGPQIPKQMSAASVHTTMAQSHGFQHNPYPQMPFGQPPPIHHHQVQPVQQPFIPFQNHMPQFPMQLLNQGPPANFSQQAYNPQAPSIQKHNFPTINALAGGGGPEANLKNKLSDDLVKLLSGGASGDGVKSTPPPPMALSLEEVEQMQFRA